MSLIERMRRYPRTVATVARQLGPVNTLRYLRVRRRRTGGEDDPEQAVLHSFRPRNLGGQEVYIREGCSDIRTLDDAICHGYYLPPVALDDCMVVVDLGANIGCCAAHFAALYPQARVIAVELDAGNAEMARRNTEGLEDRVRVIRAAVWSLDGTVSYSGDEGDAFHVEAGGDGERSVRAISMPTLMEEEGIERIDYLKMDVEGAEEEILCEADPSWLRQVRCLKVEIHSKRLFDPIMEVLASHGFHAEKDGAHWSCIAAWRKG